MPSESKFGTGPEPGEGLAAMPEASAPATGAIAGPARRRGGRRVGEDESDRPTGRGGEAPSDDTVLCVTVTSLMGMWGRDELVTAGELADNGADVAHVLKSGSARKATAEEAEEYVRFEGAAEAAEAKKVEAVEAKKVEAAEPPRPTQAPALGPLRR
jgi:hypothetical protein